MIEILWKLTFARVPSTLYSLLSNDPPYSCSCHAPVVLLEVEVVKRPILARAIIGKV